MNRNTLLALVAVPTLAGSLLLMAKQTQAATSSLAPTSCSVPIAPEMSPSTIRPTADAVAAVSAPGMPEQGVTQSDENSIDEDSIMNFTAAESDAAVALFGCDCPACMRVLHQLQRQTFSQVLLSSNQGHCWDALRQHPQEAQAVLRELEAGAAN